MIETAIGATALIAGGAWWALDTAPPVTCTLDQWLCALAALVLGQGLVRDVKVILSRRRERAAHPDAPPAPVDPPTRGEGGPELNLCLESTAGLTLLALGLFYVVFPVPPQISLPRGAVLAGIGAVLLVGWHSRDWVLTLRYLRDHYDVPVYRNRRK